MVIFHSYVSLPEGNRFAKLKTFSRRFLRAKSFNVCCKVTCRWKLGNEKQSQGIPDRRPAKHGKTWQVILLGMPLQRQKSMAMTQDPIHWRYLPYIRPIFQGYVRGYPSKIWPYMVQYLHFGILEFPLKKWCFQQTVSMWWFLTNRDMVSQVAKDWLNEWITDIRKGHLGKFLKLAWSNQMLVAQTRP